MSETDLLALEEDRRTLIEFSSRAPDDDPYAQNLMRTTFALQRHAINGARTVMQVKELVAKWHILERKCLFLCHANILLGKNLETAWHEAFASDLQIFNFFAEYADKQVSCKAKKMKEFMATSSQATEALECDVPKRAAILPLLALYLGDNLEELFLLVKVSAYNSHLVLFSQWRLSFLFCFFFSLGCFTKCGGVKAIGSHSIQVPPSSCEWYVSPAGRLYFIHFFAE